MKRPLKLLFCALALLLALAACKPKAQPAPLSPVSQATAPQATLPAQAGVAVVSALEVLRDAANPALLSVVARGELPDACTRIDQAASKLDGTTFTLSLTTQRPAGSSCPPESAPFERVIPLDTANLSEGVYTIAAGAIRQTFEVTELKESTTAAAPEQPAPTPTPNAISGSSESSSKNTSTGATTTNTSSGAMTTTTNQPGCENKAAFVDDVTVPDGTTLYQGEAFTKTWRIRNAGSCDFGPDYLLIFAGGDNMSGGLSIPMPVIKAGDYGDVTIELNAPRRGGNHTGTWVFQTPAGERFGVNAGGIDRIWVDINVSYVTDSNNVPVTGTTSTISNPVGVMTSAPCSVQSNSAFENRVIELVNKLRADNGLAPLTPQPQLQASALVHSADMACNKFTGHDGTDGSTWATRIAAQGYPASATWENTIWGYDTPEAAYDWWFHSPTHYANMMQANAKSIGVGFAQLAGSPYTYYCTINFARP